MSLLVEIKRVRENSLLPEASGVGYDLFSPEFFILQPMERRLVPTGISIKIPKGYYGRITSVSGVASKGGVLVLDEIIEPSYRGEVGVTLLNLNLPEDLLAQRGKALPAISSLFGPRNAHRVSRGDKVAQIIITQKNILPLKIL